jgi:hypothetical protein
MQQQIHSHSTIETNNEARARATGHAMIINLHLKTLKTIHF